GSHTRTAAQHHLVAHELAVVLAERSPDRAVSGIGSVRTLGPLPNVAQHLLDPLPAGRGLRLEQALLREGALRSGLAGGHLPLRLGRQAALAPAGEGVGLEEADVADREIRIDRFHSPERELPPSRSVRFP